MEFETENKFNMGMFVKLSLINDELDLSNLKLNIGRDSTELQSINDVLSIPIPTFDNSESLRREIFKFFFAIIKATPKLAMRDSMLTYGVYALYQNDISMKTIRQISDKFI